MMARPDRTLIFGWLALFLGGLLLLNWWHPLAIGWAFLMALGGLLLIAGFSKRDSGVVFPGTFLFLLGLLLYLKKGGVVMISWWELWPVIILILGISFLMHFIFNPARMGVMWLALILIFSAFALLFLPFCWYGVIFWSIRLWPVLLIIVGLCLIIKALKKRD